MSFSEQSGSGAGGGYSVIRRQARDMVVFLKKYKYQEERNKLDFSKFQEPTANS
jgi:hypothetical protein